MVRTVTRPDGGEFFARNGILFLSVDEVQRNMDELIKAEPFLGTLAADPTLRGVLGAISQSLEGVRLKKTTLEDMRPAVSAIADALERVEQGQHPAFSWRRLISGRAPEAIGSSAVRQHAARPQLSAISSPEVRRPRSSGRRSPNWA